MRENKPDEIRPIDGTNFDEMTKAVNSVKFNFSRPFRGLGKRAAIPLAFSFAGRTVEFFCEAAVLESKPEDPAIGFTKADVYYFEGVVLYDHEGSDTENVFGEMLAFENFLAKYVDDPMARVFLARKMDELREASRLDEEAIQNVNSMYMNREVGEKIVDIRLH